MSAKRTKRLIRTDEIEGGWPTIEPIVRGGEHLLDKVNIYIKVDEDRKNAYTIVVKLEHKHEAPAGEVGEFEPHEIDMTSFDEHTSDNIPKHVVIRLRDSITSHNRVVAMAHAIALTYDLIITFDIDDYYGSSEMMKFRLIPKEPYGGLQGSVFSETIDASQFYEFLDEGA